MSNNEENVSKKIKYAMEHLATFRVHDSVNSIEQNEKLRSLAELYKRQEIWPMKIYMSFSNEYVTIFDENNVEVDNFPGSKICEPKAFIDTASPLTEYDNLLVFYIAEDSNQYYEMHIFQVKGISAAVLAEDIRALLRGELDALRRTRALVPKSSQDAHELAVAAAEVAVEKKMHDKVQLGLDMQVMNQCFEDIERFGNRLQYVREIMHDINERQSISGDGNSELLFTRHRVPTIQDFQDILAKQKHAFNFVAKLQAHLPDATETTRQLLQTLRRFVEGCKAIHNIGNVAVEVKDPLLHKSTLRLIRSCLTHKDDEDFWLALGVNWNRAQEWFRNYQSDYKPIFYDKLSSERLDVGNSNRSSSNSSSAMYNNSKGTVQGSNVQNSVHFNSRLAWLNHLMANNAKIAEVINDFEARNDRELQIFKGEYLEILHDKRNWWKVRNINGNMGFVPYTALHRLEYEDRNVPSSSIVEERKMSNGQDQWKNQEISNNHKQQNQSLLAKQFMAHPLVLRDSIKRTNSVPPPVPPPMPPTPYNKKKPLHANLILRSSEVKAAVVEKINEDDKADCVSLASVATINEELELILKQRQLRKDLEILKTPQIYISAESTPTEVSEWLRGKGFSDIIVQKLGKMTGLQLFSLSAHAIENFFGQKESRRLISQIVLQKNFCEYKTIRSTELSTKLARARLKVDEQEDNDYEMNATIC